MKTSDLKQMIDYTRQWKAWLQSVKMSDKDEIGKKELVDQMNKTIKKWEKKL